MKIFLATVLSALFLVTSTQAQISESTDDWPAWQKISAGSLSSLSLLVTLAALGGDDDGDGGGSASETDSSNDSGTDSGDSNSSNDSGSDSDSGDSESGESNSENSGNDRKAQGYVEELKDDLLSFLGYAAEHATQFETEEEQRVVLEEEFPVLNDYYRELETRHPEVISTLNDKISGGTQIDRLNQLMVIHLFEER